MTLHATGSILDGVYLDVCSTAKPVLLAVVLIYMHACSVPCHAWWSQALIEEEAKENRKKKNQTAAGSQFKKQKATKRASKDKVDDVSSKKTPEQVAEEATALAKEGRRRKFHADTVTFPCLACERARARV